MQRRRRGIKSVALAMVLGLTAAACGDLAGPGAEAGPVGDAADIDRSRLADVDAAQIAEVADGVDAFGFALLDELRDGGVGGDGDEAGTVLSPISAAVLLALLLPGAEGETAEEIAGALDLDADAVADGRVGALLVELAGAADVELTLANAAWFAPDYPVEEAYRDEVRTALGARVDELDLADADEVAEIDAWADERTDGLIEEITDALDLPDSNAVGVLANATHFAADWTDRFDPDDTRTEPFTRDDGSEVEAELMHHDDTDVFVAVDPDRDLVLARLPYGDHEEANDARFGFEVLLPTDETPIAEVLDDVGAEQWRELSERARPEELPVALPAFDLEAEHDLEDPLRALGIERAWGDGHDFTGMSPANPWLETVAQKAVIEVDEEGTEAAAVTGGVMAESAPAVTEVIVDRSFAFAIRDTETGVPLFLGTVDDPS